MFALAVLPVTGATAAGWLLLFGVLLAVPPSSRDDDGTPSRQRNEPPAVVGLLARRLRRYGFAATLADLSARGWFLVRPPGVCVVAAEPPAERLTDYERRVVAHVALRAGVHGEVPAPALSDGFAGGKAEFMKAFRAEVAADVRRRRLTRVRLGPGRIVVLCALLLVPAWTALLAMGGAQRHGAFGLLGLGYAAACVLTIGIGVRRRPNATGRAVLDGWRAAVDAAPGSGGRLEAYATALGRSPGTAAIFAASGKNVVWSRYRGSWQELPVERSGWLRPRATFVLLATTLGPIVLIGVVLGLVLPEVAAPGKLLPRLAAVAVVAGGVAAATRRLYSSFAEFDGQVVRQTMKKSNDDEHPDQYFVVVDDGARARAWNLPVSGAVYPRLTPGTFVHARVKLCNWGLATVDPVEPATVARPLAQAADEQRRADAEGGPTAAP